jgi:hypothetical protein
MPTAKGITITTEPVEDTTAAGAPPAPRERRTPAQIAKAKLEGAVARFEAKVAKRDRLKAELEKAHAETEHLAKEVRYLAQHPALEKPDVESAVASTFPDPRDQAATQDLPQD